MENSSFKQDYEKKLNSDVFLLSPNPENALLQLELTNICNHACLFCPNSDSSRARKMMDKGFAQDIIRQCADLGVKKICYHMNGESLIHPDLIPLVAYSKQLGYTYTFVTTNGSLASEDYLKALLDAGLDSIKFSINAGTRETYQAIHGKDDFEKAINALKFTYEYRRQTGKRYRILVSYAVTKLTANDVGNFYLAYKKYADDILFYHLCTYAGQAARKIAGLYVDISDKAVPVMDIKHSLPCAVLNNSINVTSEGYLSLCCSEANNLLVIEDLNTMPVKEAWLGSRMTAIRQKHLSGDIQDMQCFACIYNVDMPPKPLNTTLFNRNKRVKT